MTYSEIAGYWGFGFVLGYGLQWLLGLIKLLTAVPSAVIGRD